MRPISWLELRKCGTTNATVMNQMNLQCTLSSMKEDLKNPKKLMKNSCTVCPQYLMNKTDTLY